MKGLGKLLFLAGFGCSLSATVTAQEQNSPRSREGDWAISDSTDNNTGEREVYAFQMYFPEHIRGYVTLSMKCVGGKPTFIINWTEITFPAQSVVTISPTTASDPTHEQYQYVMRWNDDPILQGLHASPENSARIVDRIGASSQVMVSTHLPNAARTVTIDVRGAARAWDRVRRHCPVRLLPVPPL